LLIVLLRKELPFPGLHRTKIKKLKLFSGVLSLRENQLSHLPSEIGTCIELHVLDVSGNRLQHLPFTLTNLNLKALWLAENQVWFISNPGSNIIK
jgi:Leucine-rich repeat (LRR) protein